MGKNLGKRLASMIAALLAVALSVSAQPQQPTGEIKGSAWQHTQTSLADAVANGALVLPAAATGRGVYEGKFKDAPTVTGRFYNAAQAGASRE